MKKISTIIALFTLLLTFGQNGINYKALIKDANGNVVSNQQITVELTLFQTQAFIQVYEESHTPTTDNNGLINLIIGTGSTTDSFGSVEWDRGEIVLNVQIDTGDGLVDFGLTEFEYMPFAYAAETATIAQNVTGLEAIDEGNGIGWRLVGSDPSNYGTIGEGAVDLSYSNINSTTYGATGKNSTTLGIRTSATGDSSVAIGSDSTASDDFSVAIGAGAVASEQQSVSIGGSSQASGFASVALGNFTEASGNYAFASGQRTRAQSQNSTAIGRYNIGGGSSTTWNDLDPLFEIGNGSSNTDRSNALTIMKSGAHTLSSRSYGMVINTGNSSNDFGLRINESGDDGIQVNNSTVNGIVVNNAGNIGAIIEGEQAGIRATSLVNENPDIVLGANGSGSSQDDGIISSAPNFSSSDLYLLSNDAVIIDLDQDNNEAGNFRIRNSNQDVVFDISELGDVTVEGVLTIGTASLQNIFTDFLEINKSTIPTLDGQFALGADTRRWATVWAVDGTINTSDRRDKKNITSLDYGLDEVLKMKPVSFNWKNKNNPDLKLGLIAQNLQKLVPEVVKSHTWEVNEMTNTLIKKEANRLGVYYSDLVPVLIKAIQEQQEIIENQLRRIQALEDQNQGIKQLTVELEKLKTAIKTKTNSY